MATVQTLKDKNDGTFYPVTKTEAVYNADGSENLSVTLTKKANISTGAGDADKVMMADGSKALVGTSSINNGAVTAAKIDFSTIGYWEITFSSNISVNQGAAYSYVDVPGSSLTFTAEVGGVYLVLFAGGIRCNSSSDSYARVIINSTELFSAMTQAPSNSFGGMSGARSFTATQASNTLKLRIGGGVANATYTLYSGSSIQIIRVK